MKKNVSVTSTINFQMIGLIYKCVGFLSWQMVNDKLFQMSNDHCGMVIKRHKTLEQNLIRVNKHNNKLMFYLSEAIWIIRNHEIINVKTRKQNISMDGTTHGQRFGVRDNTEICSNTHTHTAVFTRLKAMKTNCLWSQWLPEKRETDISMRLTIVLCIPDGWLMVSSDCILKRRCKLRDSGKDRQRRPI